MAAPKTEFAVRTWQLARRGLGTEDIWVSLRQNGVTMEYIRSVVFQVEASRIRVRTAKANRAKKVA